MDLYLYKNNLSPAAKATAKPLLRKSQRDLDSSERRTFKSAIGKAIRAGIYSRLVAIHGEMQHRMHTMAGMGGPAGTQRFLPWHRDYLLKMEQELRVLEPGFFIPYWDWTQDRVVPEWLSRFRPTGVRDAAGRRISIRRRPGQDSAAPSLPSPSDLAAVTARSQFTPFTLALEGASPFGAHNLVHVWVGGTMAQIPSAPADPLFWLHHAQVDRIWASWQKSNPAQHPLLNGTNAVLDPWPETAEAVDDLTALGYEYA